MKNIAIFFFVLFGQLAFAQKYPIHYKIVETTVSNDQSTQTTFYISVRESSNTEKQKQLVLSLDGMEEIDLKDKSVNFSTLKTDDIINGLGSSSNFLGFVQSYLNYPLTF